MDESSAARRLVRLRQECYRTENKVQDERLREDAKQLLRVAYEPRQAP